MKKISILISVFLLFCGVVFPQTREIRQNIKIPLHTMKYLSLRDSIAELDSIKKADSVSRIYREEVQCSGSLNIQLPDDIIVEKKNIGENPSIPDVVDIQSTKKKLRVQSHPPPPPSPTPVNPSDVSIKELQKTGQINYVIKDTMVVGITNEVNVTISSGVVISRIIRDIETFNEHNLQTDTIPISATMRARLIDPSGVNFRIIPMTEMEQFLIDVEYTLWKWNVTPLNKGNNKLSISVDIVVDNKSKVLKVYDGVIYVYSDETIFDKIWGFILDNWEFIVGSLFIPIFVYLWSLRKKKED